jgi:hypothetical protein
MAAEDVPIFEKAAGLRVVVGVVPIRAGRNLAVLIADQRLSGLATDWDESLV